MRMVDEFISYGILIFCTFFYYYQKIYLYLYVDLYKLQNYSISAQIFDPFVLREVSIETHCALDDELVHFIYYEYFTTSIISSLKTFLPKDKAEARI